MITKKSLLAVKFANILIEIYIRYYCLLDVIVSDRDTYLNSDFSTSVGRH
jgi:hypothetical protein